MSSFLVFEQGLAKVWVLAVQTTAKPKLLQGPDHPPGGLQIPCQQGEADGGLGISSKVIMHHWISIGRAALQGFVNQHSGCSLSSWL